MLDLYLLPFNLISGQEQPDLPGLFACTPPRRANRHRSGDRLAMLLTLTGSSTLNPEEGEHLFQSLSSAYYSSSGSTTAAMRAAASDLHNFLLSRNLRRQREGSPTLGLLNLAVIRADNLFLLHAGPTHSYILGRDQVQEFHEDSQQAGSGLGLSRTIGLRFFQIQLQPGNLLLFCPEAPAALTPAALAHKEQISLEGLRRRLFSLGAAGMQAALIQFRPGNGQIHRLKARAPLSITPPGPIPVPAPETPPVKPAPQVPTAEAMPVETAPVTAAVVSTQPQPTPAGETTDTPAPETPAGPASPAESTLAVELAAPAPTAKPRIAERPQAPAMPESASVVKPAAPALAARVRPAGRPQAPTPPHTRLGRKARPALAFPLLARLQSIPLRKHLATSFLAARSAGQRLQSRSRDLLLRMLPGMGEEVPHPPASLLLFIAIAIPLIVVAISTTVYMRSGREIKQMEYLQQAQKYMDAAAIQSDPVLQRSAWIAALKQLDNAEQIKRDDRTYALRRKAQDALDLMDGVNRLYLTPLLPDAFSLASRFTRIAATGSEIYLLDSARNLVMRLVASGQGYALDNQFNCSAVSARSKPIVDIVTLPLNNQYRATVLAVDEAGFQTYCIPNNQPLTNQLTPDDRGWGKVIGASLRPNTLFVLDGQTQDILRYYDAKYDFGDQPRSFFSNQTLNLKDVIDMELSEDDLYLLRQNGRMAICSATSYNTLQVRCSDPAPYGDSRPNRERQPISFPDAHFSQMQIIAPPDPSLFILDTNMSAVYHFSLRYMNLQRILQPAPAGNFALPQTAATAFTVTPMRVVLVAYGNQLFYAPLP